MRLLLRSVPRRLPTVLRHAAMTLGVSSACGFMNAAEKPATPPATTSHASARAEGSTGKIIASKNGDEPVKSASTTKVMCALVVLELAKQDAAVLDEQVTFSKLADDTEGSTCDIKVGEKIRVRDGLYAMLLPSGNDMGN